MPEPKDVVLGILGASGALAGLLLVFAGFIFAQAASFPSSTDDAMIAKYVRAGRMALIPFWGFLITTLLCIWWLIYQIPCVYSVSVVGFVLLVIGTGIYATVVSYRYL